MKKILNLTLASMILSGLCGTTYSAEGYEQQDEKSSIEINRNRLIETYGADNNTRTMAINEELNEIATNGIDLTDTINQFEKITDFRNLFIYEMINVEAIEAEPIVALIKNIEAKKDNIVRNYDIDSVAMNILAYENSPLRALEHIEMTEEQM